MTAALRDACADLAAWLPAGAALIAEQDADGTSAHGKPGSRPPWNAAAANAVYDAHAGLRRHHAMLHAEVTGQPLTHVASAAHATGGHIRAIVALGVNASHASAQDTARAVTGWVIAIQQLPAVDEAERFIRVHGAECPYCHMPMLRLGARSGRVACLRFGSCYDSNGEHPSGFVSHSVSGDAFIAWNDGYSQYADVVVPE